MDEYFLTEEDIMRLDSAGFDMMNTEAGMEALSSEAEFLRNTPATPAPLTGGAGRRARRSGGTLQETSATTQVPAVTPDPAPLQPEVTGSAPVQLEVTDPSVIPTQTPTPSQGVNRDAILAALLSSQPTTPAEPVDPYANLSKTQRRMLAFAGLSDAGAALQGRSGGNVSSLLGRFNEMADMERKRQAAAQQNAAILSIAGGKDGSALMAIDSPEAARARAQYLANLALTNPSLVPALTLKISELNKMAERMEAQSAETAAEVALDASTLKQAKSTMATARRALSASLGVDGEELDEALAAGELDPSRFALARRTGGFMSDRYKQFEAAAKELEAIMTFQNMGDVIEAGAALGTLSDADMLILGRLSGVIDAANSPIETAETIFRIYGKLNETIAKLEQDPSAVNDISSAEQALIDKYRRMSAENSENGEV